MCDDRYPSFYLTSFMILSSTLVKLVRDFIFMSIGETIIDGGLTLMLAGSGLGVYRLLDDSYLLRLSEYRDILFSLIILKKATKYNQK